MKIVISLHIFAVLSEFCNYSQRIQGIKNMKSSVSKHIAHVDLCSNWTWLTVPFHPKTPVAGGLFDLQCVSVLSWSGRQEFSQVFLWVSEFISDSEGLMSMC